MVGFPIYQIKSFFEKLIVWMERDTTLNIACTVGHTIFSTLFNVGKLDEN
jgi:hypothetical protein